MQVLVVGGTFDKERGKASGLINKLSDALICELRNYKDSSIDIRNGGNYDELLNIMESTPNYDVIFWMANVDNSLPKIRDVKEYAPHSLLVTSKRNDRDENGVKKYDMEELVQRALSVKANLCIEFSKNDLGKFDMLVFDPLGCLWYEGEDIEKVASSLINRLIYLNGVTRKGTIRKDDYKFNIEFDNVDREFLDLVHEYGESFHTIMGLPSNVTRFVGNCSLRFKSPTRCMNGFPAIRKGNIILMSRRNVDKKGISEKDFVPVFEEGDKLLYQGENKPSVDTPVQIRLFENLPNIDYIIHGHCYVTGEIPKTLGAVPCGAIEEISEVLSLIDRDYKDRNLDSYIINLKGHGCLLMCSKKSLDKIKNIEFEARPLPEKMF